jgi:hypothetical protein
MDARELKKDIEKLLGQAQALVHEAEAIADEHGLTFSLDIGGYGMGGYYDPNDREDQWGNDNGGWHASSQSC